MASLAPHPDQQFLWLIEAGRSSLNALKVHSPRPLRIDWSGTHFADWQRALLEEQWHFRARSSARFPDPELWLWTDRSLQQASDWQSAVAKSQLFQANSRVVDACCGAGADLVALSQRHQTLALDRDRKMLQLSRANMRAHDLETDYVQAELPGAIEPGLASCGLGGLSQVCLHADPDRRRGESRDTRTTHAEAFSPPLNEIMKLGNHARACIVKLAPATEIELGTGDQQWRRAWLGSGRECPQQLLMRGELTWCIPEGCYGAMLVEHVDQPFVGSPRTHCAVADEPESYLVEPHAALYASGLASAWAEQHDLSALPHSSSYFTGEANVTTPWAQSFEVIEHMSWDERRVRKWLKAHHIGPVEVKTRQVSLDANQLQRQLSQSDGEPISCLLYRIGKSIRVVMARRTAQ